MITVEVDIVPEAFDDSFEELSNLWPGLRFRVVTLDGPAGGNPLIAVEGERADVRAFLREYISESSGADAVGEEDIEEEIREFWPQAAGPIV